MSTHYTHSKPRTLTGGGSFLRLILFFLILVLSVLVMTVNYWIGVGILFLSIFVFIVLSFKHYQKRNLFLLIYFHILAAFLIINLILALPDLREAVTGTSSTTLTVGDGLIILLIGIIGSLVLVGLPFLLIIAAAAVVISKWHTGPGYRAFSSAFIHTLYGVLGFGYFMISVVDNELKGSDEDKERLTNFGGPGWLVIHIGHVVVLQRQGAITRVVGAGSVMLGRQEQIKAILPLLPQGKPPDPISNVLTRDRIPLTIKVGHAAALESTSDTDARLEQAVKDAQAKLAELTHLPDTDPEKEKATKDLDKANQQVKEFENAETIGDEFNKCYKKIAILAGRRAPDVWKSAKGSIEDTIRDAIMTVEAEDLFKITGEDTDLKARIDKRKIAELETHTKQATEGSAAGKGIKLLGVNIIEVTFPEEVRKKIEEEVNKLIEERIEATNARIAESKAKANIVTARARSQARILEGQGEGEAQAALFRQILRELKREEVLSEDDIAKALLALITSNVSVKELQKFFKATASVRYQTKSGSDEINESE